MASRISGESSPIERYYKFHSKIYDATRWSFLFGRTAILDAVAAGGSPTNVLEVGCGTGKNLENICRKFPKASVTGVDLSETMMGIARQKVIPFGNRVRLLRQAYNAPLNAAKPEFDLILFSYALTMFNPGFDTAVQAAFKDLRPGGRIAVIDFHDTRFPLFARWMGVNHVRMEGQLHPLLTSLFKPLTDRVHNAYLGVWRYIEFIGLKD